MLRAPRPYQTATLDATRAAIRNGSRAPLIVAPTGAGKTFLGTSIVDGTLSKNGTAVWLAHTRELVDQAVESIRGEGIPANQITTLRAGKKNFDPTKPVCVASTQTMLVCEQLPPATVLILDEAHHYIATEFNRVADNYKKSLRVGLTATPLRSDGAPMGDLFDSIIQCVTYRELIESGVLVPCDVIAPESKLKSRTLANDPVSAYQEHAPGSLCMVFCVDVEEAKQCAARFMSEGIPAACVEGSMPNSERAKIFERFKAGQIRVLTNVYICTEGVDIPAASTCILARGCGSRSTYMQIAGRVLRSHPGKTRALMIDLCGNWKAHGLPDDDVVWSLDGNGVVKAVDPDAVKQCNECGFVARIWQGPCPRCEFVNPVKPITIAYQKLTPVERGAIASAAEKQAYYNWLCREQRTKNYARGWVAHRFKARFDAWPTGLRETQ